VIVVIAIFGNIKKNFEFNFISSQPAHNNAPPASAAALRPAHSHPHTPAPITAPAKQGNAFDDLLGIMDSPGANKAAPADPFASSAGSTGVTGKKNYF
jgi:hypothetical protein